MRLQPITRKERFLYEIVGWGETAPKNELTTEELFFAKILGRNVTLPDLSNVPRYYLLLAKIAGENVNVTPPTYVSPPLEFFLAKAAGMDVTTPIPLTKEEIFWANYKGREQIIEGVPPLTFKSSGANLSNYRIYGNTVNGESVGDKTNNLLSVLPDGRTNKGITYENKNNLYMQIAGKSTDVYSQTNEKNIFLQAGTYYIRFFCDDTAYKQNLFALLRHSDNRDIVNEFGNGTKFTLENDENIKMIIGVIQSNVEINTNIYVQIVKDIKPSAFEPYGYRVPVTINSNTTNIYLPEQLTKTNDNTDYIDYATQKRYNADGTSQSIELPTLQTVEGTNTLSVGTTVQPSKVMIKTGKFGTHKVRYYDSDGTFLSAEDVKDGTNAQGFTPTKASTAQYNYTFMGWSTTKGSTTSETGVLNDITADKSLYAVFSQSLRTFTVYFYNGSTLLQTAENVQYGGTATYTGEAPTKDGFTFSGWQPSNVNVTADTSCYAQFTEG